ncbi:hypothetical protein ACFQI7_19990 [Paenibacillus allorhizosphaerae]|uniref:Uncharacterized protein n=1 Tax=Paenibacillus allorhizosphaerae TaxID=2849866 RepID=A0ABN7TSD2_9BACL|nr:hypothetical protein [Paenibacillus allorhizosphaerae]CAG7647279.1 hypothetical protein PAECIP111802_03935 [Paenibacillus allorhizosphaerae]
MIAAKSKEAGLAKVYIPKKTAVEDNPLLDMKVLSNRALELQYKYMTVIQSVKTFEEVKEATVKKVELAGGIHGEWIGDKAGLPKNRLFRFQIDSCYIVLEDMRNLPEREVQAIAESFALLR